MSSNTSAISEYQVTARKWRPTEFESVVGQEHVTQTIKNAIKNSRLHHAYLFSGPRGVGKTTTARILAKALNCEHPSADFEPDNTCDSCRAITEGRSLDVVEIDGASNNSVDDIRKLRDSARYAPVNGKYKLYIIDEVHMLSTSAFNALLKTLEEPPKHLIFIFATTEPHKVPATILSRCQRFDFRRMQIEDIVKQLTFISEREGFSVEEDALIVIAKKADGSMRDSQSIFDQVISFCGTSVTYQQANEALNLIDQEFFFRVSDMMRSHDTAEAFAIIEEVMRTGYDPQEFLIGLSEHLRNFLMVLTTQSTRLIEAAKAHRERYQLDSQSFDKGDITRALHLVLTGQQQIRTASQPRLRMELTLIQLATMDSTVQLNELLEKIEKMGEGGGSGGGTTVAPRPAANAFGVTPPSRVAAPAAPATSAEPAASYSATAPAITPPAVEDSGAPMAPLPDSNPVAKAPRASTKARDLASFPTAAPAGAFKVASAAAPVVSSTTKAGANGKSSEPRQLTIREIQAKWMDFIRSCETDQPVFASQLRNLHASELAGTLVRFYVDTEFQRDYIVLQRALLTERLSDFFETPLHVEPVLGTAPALVKGETAPPPNVSKELLEHPFVKGLVDHLGAAPLM